MEVMFLSFETNPIGGAPRIFSGAIANDMLLASGIPVFLPLLNVQERSQVHFGCYIVSSWCLNLVLVATDCSLVARQ